MFSFYTASKNTVKFKYVPSSPIFFNFFGVRAIFSVNLGERIMSRARAIIFIQKLILI